MENWANAQNQAISTAKNMAGEATVYEAPPWFWSDQYDSNIQIVGYPGGGDESVAYCMQTYRSYDPRSGTYLGNDGYRHPCP